MRQVWKATSWGVVEFVSTGGEYSEPESVVLRSAEKDLGFEEAEGVDAIEGAGRAIVGSTTAKRSMRAVGVEWNIGRELWDSGKWK